MQDYIDFGFDYAIPSDPICSKELPHVDSTADPMCFLGPVMQRPCDAQMVTSSEHRDKDIGNYHTLEALLLVARPVKSSEWYKIPEALQAVKDEWAKLRKNNTWLEDKVEEYDVVRQRGIAEGRQIIFSQGIRPLRGETF